MCAAAEPMSMTVVIGVVVACLALLVIVTLFVLYTFKTEKWCFARKYCSAAIKNEIPIESNI